MSKMYKSKYVGLGVVMTAILSTGLFTANEASMNTAPAEDKGVKLSVKEPNRELSDGNTPFGAEVDNDNEGESDELASENEGKAESTVASQHHFSDEMSELMEGVAAGKPVDITFDGANHRFSFAPSQVTTDTFGISLGEPGEMDASIQVYSGVAENSVASVENKGSLSLIRATMAVVNDSVSVHITQSDREILISRDASGEVRSTLLGTDSDHKVCDHDEHVGHNHHNNHPHDANVPLVASVRATEKSTAVAAAAVHEPWDASADIKLTSVAALEEPSTGNATAANASSSGNEVVTRDYARYGAQYDASLKDLHTIWVFTKAVTGNRANIASKAAEALANFAAHSELYQRQLGLRPQLVELIMIPKDDDSQEDVGGANSDWAYGKLVDFTTWINNKRDRSIYQYGHAALFTNIPGRIAGMAWLEEYGHYFGTSINEPRQMVKVYNHELGHNVGSPHTRGGIMNSVARGGSFFKEVKKGSGAGSTGAKLIYDYLHDNQEAFFETEPLRNPDEIPWANSDTVSTPMNAPVRLNPLQNDQNRAHHKIGKVNQLQLVEVGDLFPVGAGEVDIIGDEVLFTPALDFSGEAKVSYTLGGDVGNDGKGWLHSADITFKVGISKDVTTGESGLVVRDDYLETEQETIQFNPLLNDESTGYLGTGNIAITTDLEAGNNFSEVETFHLTGAQVISGQGTLTLEERPLIDASQASSGFTGYLTYTFAEGESSAIIEYAVSDVGGSTATAKVYINVDTSNSGGDNGDSGGDGNTDGDSNGGNSGDGDGSGDGNNNDGNNSDGDNNTRLPQLNFAQSADRVNEGDYLSIPLSLDSTSSKQVSVQYSFAGSATALEDFVDESSNVGELIIAAGNQSGEIRLHALQDGLQEGVESIILTLDAVNNARIPADNRKTVTLVDAELSSSDMITGQLSKVRHNWSAVTAMNDRRQETGKSYALLAQMQTFKGGDTAGVRMDNRNDQWKVKIEEEQSRDREVRHTREVVGYLGIGPGLISDKAGVTVGEAGQMTLPEMQSDRDQWFELDLMGEYKDPVVIMGVSSFNGTSPVNIRVRKNEGGVEYQLEEWAYDDGAHAQEAIAYVVFEKGAHELLDGYLVVAGSTTAGRDFSTQSLTRTFADTPVVLSQIASEQDRVLPLVPRLRDINRASFAIRLQEEEKLRGELDEVMEVDYLAIGKAPKREGSNRFSKNRESKGE